MRFVPVNPEFVAQVEEIDLTAPLDRAGGPRSMPAWIVTPCWCSAISR